VHRLSQGQVVEVEITDPRGQNKKRRPAVVVTATAELSDAKELVVVAISHKLEDPLPSDWILLPWSGKGGARSGLTQPCVAKCRWIRKVSPNDVLFVRGHLPDTVVRDIMRAVTRE
jgi:mRNA-degrading endonuclease toxin of MazEF toxin-antitoxin module